MVTFNLDRSIVLSVKKSKKASWQPWLTATPRLVLAVALGVIIAKPLELQLFFKRDCI